MYIYILYIYVCILDELTLYQYITLFLVSYNRFWPKIYLIRYSNIGPAIFSVTICMENSFASFYFQSMCVFGHKKAFLQTAYSWAMFLTILSISAFWLDSLIYLHLKLLIRKHFILLLFVFCILFFSLIFSITAYFCLFVCLFWDELCWIPSLFLRCIFIRNFS